MASTCGRRRTWLDGRPGEADAAAARAVAQVFRVCALAEGAVERTQHPRALMTRGWAHYRRGGYAEAVRDLDDAPGRTAEMEPQALCCLSLAMAHARQGRWGEAEAMLGRAVRLIEEDMPRGGSDPRRPAFGWNWQNRIHAGALRREAESVVGAGQGDVRR